LGDKTDLKVMLAFFITITVITITRKGLW